MKREPCSSTGGEEGLEGGIKPILLWAATCSERLEGSGRKSNTNLRGEKNRYFHLRYVELGFLCSGRTGLPCGQERKRGKLSKLFTYETGLTFWAGTPGGIGGRDVGVGYSLSQIRRRKRALVNKKRKSHLSKGRCRGSLLALRDKPLLSSHYKSRSTHLRGIGMKLVEISALNRLSSRGASRRQGGGAKKRRTFFFRFH